MTTQLCVPQQHSLNRFQKLRVLQVCECPAELAVNATTAAGHCTCHTVGTMLLWDTQMCGHLLPEVAAAAAAAPFGTCLSCAVVGHTVVRSSAACSRCRCACTAAAAAAAMAGAAAAAFGTCWSKGWDVVRCLVTLNVCLLCKYK